MSTIYSQDGTLEHSAGQQHVARHHAPAKIHANERVEAVIPLEQWVNDEAVEVDRVTVDLSQLFETTPLEDLPDEVPNHEGDNYYYEAVALGIAPDHAGPFSLSIDADQLEEYRARREEAGYLERDFPSLALRAEREERSRAQIAVIEEQIEAPQRRRDELQATMSAGAAHN